MFRHEFIIRQKKFGETLGFFSYPTAWRTILAYETIHLVRKGQIEGADEGNIQAQNQVVAVLYGLGA